eukprot:6510131-Alexandrium_andersonii.AAC.1
MALALANPGLLRQDFQHGGAEVRLVQAALRGCDGDRPRRPRRIRRRRSHRILRVSRAQTLMPPPPRPPRCPAIEPPWQLSRRLGRACVCT